MCRAIEDAQEGDKKDVSDVALDGAREGALVDESALLTFEGAHESTSEGAPKSALQDLHKNEQEGTFLRLKLRLPLRLTLRCI